MLVEILKIDDLFQVFEFGTMTLLGQFHSEIDMDMWLTEKGMIPYLELV